MSLNDREIHNLIERLADKYGSLDDPRFNFVEESCEGGDGKLYFAMLNELGEVNEDTDVNDDVSFGYSLKCDGGKFYIRISMIKPYVFVMNLAGRRFLHAKDSVASDCGRNLISLLGQKGLVILGEEDLVKMVPLHLDGDRQVSIFRALFTDSDFHS